VTAAPVVDRFGLLTQGLTPTEWRLLGALGLEHGLARSVLAALWGGDGTNVQALEGWLERGVARGLLVSVGPTRALGLTSAPSRESGYALKADLAQLVLRELSGRDALKDIALATQQLLGGRSVSDLGLALQLGDLRAFQRRFSVERLPRQIPLRSAAEWLRVSICEPFDADWFVRTWADEAHAVARRVLREALDGARPCSALLAWLVSGFRELHDAEVQGELGGLLTEHALASLHVEQARKYLPFVAPDSARGYAAVLAFVDGDAALAADQLELAFGSSLRAGARRLPLPRCGSMTPVLGLLLGAREDESSRSLAKRLMSVGTSDAARDSGRAFRALLRYLEQPESEHERIDVHDLGSGAAVWEILIAAHNVQLHQKQPETRARWAQHLVRLLADWQAGGYAWLAAQALLLARELSAEYADQELARLGVTAPASRPALSLWDLIAPKPEWQKTLQALSSVSEEVENAAEASLRVVWYVDMADGSMSRPGLQEQRTGSAGFSQGRRLSLSELHQLRDRLPPEDQRVLDATRELSEGRRELLPEAFEQLVGHPRVVNGARGNLPVEVVRGVCRVTTQEDSGYVSVVVEPVGLARGISVLPEGEARLVVYRVTEAMQRVLDVLPHGMRVPQAHKSQLLNVLARLSQSVDVSSPDLGATREVEADVTPCLRFAPHAGAWQVQAGVRPFGSQGRFFVSGSGRASLTFVAGPERLRCERDFERERAGIDRLIAACPTLSGAVEESEGRPHHEVDNWVLSEVGVLTLLSELRRAELPHHVEWPESNRLRLRGDSRSALRGRLRVNKGWYLVTGGLALDDVTEVALSELVHAPALAGGRFVRLPNGDYVELEERILRVLRALRAASARAKPRAELSLHAGAIAALERLASEDGFEVDAEVTGWLERVRELQTREFPVPPELRADLRPYQQEGYGWLSRLSALGLGACLADDMGLGKTVQILALLLARREAGPALVVAPTSVCANWAREAQRFAPDLEVIEYHSDGRAALLERVRESGANKLVVCSYQMLLQDQGKLGELDWGTAVLDEAQFIKNAQSLRAQAAFRLRAQQRIAATGTPVENHAADLWSIFHFLNPGLLGDFADFNRRFVKPIERDGAQAPEEQLGRVIQPYVLRRLKRDVLTELPPVTELSHEVQLSQDETLRYAMLRKQIHDKLFSSSGKRENKIEVLAEITRLRRFCCHPRLVFPDADQECSKIQAFLELVEELRENGHRALVFSQFVDFLALVRETLDERGISYEYLDGSTPQTARQQRVDAFQNGSASLFLISLKAGGFGLNLTAADYVIHLDPWWNPAVESQATDRAHRIGQQRRVTVYRLITKQTIEEKIVELHHKKRTLARSLLDGSGAAGKLSAAELVQLIEGSSVASSAN
jgi:superfamily II DNA or RNA helicase